MVHFNWRNGCCFDGPSNVNAAQMPSTESSTPYILEIGEVSRIRHAFPETTEFFSTYVEDSKQRKPPGSELVSAMTLIPLARRLLDAKLDLVVVHASPHGPVEGLVRTLFRRSALRGHLPLFRGLAQQLLRGSVKVPMAVLDLQDSPSILKCNRYLLQKSTVYFKRELPPDRWRLLMHKGKTPTRRYRRIERYQSALSRIRPLSLGLPDNVEVSRIPPIPPGGKDIDVFFAGRLKGSSTVRERGLDELLQLQKQGIRIDIQDGGLSGPEYLARCARAWLVWAPEGYGWDCFRPYEAAFAGSVPLISRQTIERHEPLSDDEHCFYYNVEAGQLAQTVLRALNDRDRLLNMAESARVHVLRHHTPQALAHHIVSTTLAAGQAGRMA
jgi:hypothetical protein